MAPGNIYAQRGTLSFYWRARDPVGPTAFPLFRVGYADHTSWDMTWLRIDWNGKGFDAFVTDDNLARVRVSTTAAPPKPDQWILVTFTWDEAKGIALYIDGKPVASKAQAAALDAGLDQFGPHSRVISPHQVQSAYQFVRGGDVDDIRVYDRALDDAAVAGLAAGKAPRPRRQHRHQDLALPLRLEPPRRSPALSGRRQDLDPQGRVRRPVRPQAADEPGLGRHRRDHLARRLQPLQAARPPRLFRAAGLERLCRGRQGDHLHPARRAL
jgi:hypothetical protein